MHTPSSFDLFDAIDATWTAQKYHSHDGWLIREGAGGGKRVSSATLLDENVIADINLAEKAMRSYCQTPLFMIRNSDKLLDDALIVKKYKVIDPVVILIGATDDLLKNNSYNVSDVRTMNVPDKVSRNIWAAGGINQSRLNIMDRVEANKTILVKDDMGVAFAAVYNQIAMVHAVEVAKNHRRKGVANAIMQKAFEWAKIQCCAWTAVLTVRDNIPARKLYAKLGMVDAAAYHYRIKSSE